MIDCFYFDVLFCFFDEGVWFFGFCVFWFCFVFYFTTTHLLSFVMCRRPFDLGIFQASLYPRYCLKKHLPVTVCYISR